MKILFITQFFPYPPDSGGKIKTWRILKLLAEKHEIFLVSFVDQKKDLQYEGEVKKICSLGVKTFVTPVITSKHRSLSKMAIAGLFHPKPFRIRKYYLGQAAEFIKKISQKISFEAVYCNHLTSVQYLNFVAGSVSKLKIFDEHNINSKAMFSYANLESNLFLKVGYFIEGLKFILYEKLKIKKFEIVFAISQKDKKNLEKIASPQGQVFYLPVPWKKNPVFEFGSRIILFVGLMSWYPNEEAVSWFVKKVFPQIKNEVSDAQFWLVGANISDKIKKSAQVSGVRILGYVKNLEKIYRRVGVFVAPVRSGGGVRIKILDALSHGLPTVSTALGVSGIPVKDGQQLLIKNSPKAFSESVVKVLKNASVANKLSKQGLEFISQNYSEEKTRKVLAELEKRKKKRV